MFLVLRAHELLNLQVIYWELERREMAGTKSLKGERLVLKRVDSDGNTGKIFLRNRRKSGESNSLPTGAGFRRAA